MASNSELNVRIIVDAAQLTSGMSGAAQTVQSASERMAASLRAAGVSAVDAASAMKNLGFTSAETSASLGQVASASASAEAPIERVARSANNARAAFMGLNSELGLHGNRALGSFIAQSETLGPALNAAFTGIAILGFIELAEKAGEKMSALIADTFIFTAAQKALYGQLVSDNKAIADNLAQQQNLMRDLQVVALPLVEQERMRAKWAQDDASGLKAKVDATEKELALQTKILNSLQAKKSIEPPVYADSGVMAEDDDQDKQIEEATQRRDSLSSSLGALRDQYKTAALAAEGLASKANSTAMKDAHRETENWAREQDRLGREEEERALRSARIQKEEAEEQTRATEKVQRSKEEEARLEAEYNQKSLEDFQRGLVQRTSLIEEQGKNELAQIQSNAELQEEITTKRKGSTSPVIAKEAFDAYTAEVAVTQQLIAAQEALQQELIETGAKQDDPKVQASLMRELALVKMLDQEWERYSKTVEKVMNAQQQQVNKVVQGIGNDLSRGIVSWMNGQETFGRAMQHVWTQFADAVVSNLVKAGVQMIAHAALSNAIDKSMQLSKAEAAASSTWASVAAIPIVGPFLAPEAAAAAFAGVMAFADGGIVPGSGPVPAIVHGGEMILNEGQQRSMMGGSTVNLHYSPSIGAGANVDDIKAHGDALVKHLKRTLRRMNR